MIQLVNHSGCFANSYFSPLPIHKISLCLTETIESVYMGPLRGGKVEYEYKSGYHHVN